MENFRDRLGLGQVSPLQATRYNLRSDWNAKRLVDDFWSRIKRLTVSATHTRVLVHMLEALVPCPEEKALEILEIAGLITRPIRLEGLKSWADLTGVGCNLTIKDVEQVRWITEPVEEVRQEAPMVARGALKNVKKLLAIRESIPGDKLLSLIWPARARGRRSLKRANRPSLRSLEDVLQAARIAVVSEGLVWLPSLDYGGA